MVLKDECKKIGLSVVQFSELVDVPESTLRKWAKNRSVLLEQLFVGFQAQRMINDMGKLQEFSFRLTAGGSEARPNTINND